MPLREIKKEVHSLQSVKDNLKDFQDNWIKPLRTNTNSHLPFLKELDVETRFQLNKKLASFHQDINNVKNGQIINEKLQHFSRYLIEMKLTNLQGDHQKSKAITKRLLNDDFFNLKQTINDVKKFDGHVKKLSDKYNDINELLHKKLSLEETLFFMDLPHKIYLYNLVKTAKKQKKIVRDIGRHFVSLAKENNPRKI